MTSSRVQHRCQRDDLYGFCEHGEERRESYVGISHAICRRAGARTNQTGCSVRDVRKAMQRKQINQALLARRIRTSRSAVARLLKAEDRSMTLRLLGRIAVALDARVRMQLAGRRPPPADAASSTRNRRRARSSAARLPQPIRGPVAAPREPLPRGSRLFACGRCSSGGCTRCSH